LGKARLLLLQVQEVKHNPTGNDLAELQLRMDPDFFSCTYFETMHVRWELVEVGKATGLEVLGYPGIQRQAERRSEIPPRDSTLSG
jgi:hypothetical protein